MANDETNGTHLTDMRTDNAGAARVAAKKSHMGDIWHGVRPALLLLLPSCYIPPLSGERDPATVFFLF